MPKQQDFDIHITGVYVHPDSSHSFQFAFSDGTMTEVNQEALNELKWKLISIPEGSIIKRYELM